MDGATVTRPTCPFPGLRPFWRQEAALFFGRSREIAELRGTLLGDRRFVAVIGTSGCGKSSLVEAGLLPRLLGEQMPGGQRWRVISLRPLAAPVAQLAVALARFAQVEQPASFGHLHASMLASRFRATLRRTTSGLVEVIREILADPATPVLVFVDQFEELFRYQPDETDEDLPLFRDEAQAFANLLLEAMRAAEPNIYVLITMRSDFFGECGRYRGLAEAVSGSQFLVPRMVREQLQEAITSPLCVAAGIPPDQWHHQLPEVVEPALVQRLLNAVGDEATADPLPVMQHALMRAWQMAANAQDQRNRPTPQLRVVDYVNAGEITEALSRHADELLELGVNAAGAALPPDGIARLFQALTDIDRGGRTIRRPQTLTELAPVVGTDIPTLMTVLDAFRGPGVSFLTPYMPVPIEEATPIDISHESLIRRWDRLRQWVEKEAESGEWYRRIADRKRIGGAYLVGSELASALHAREIGRWNKAWAERYATDRHGGRVAYDEVIAFLDKSQNDFELLRRESRMQSSTRVSRSSLIDLSYIERICAGGQIPELLAEYDDALRSSVLADDEWAQLAGFARFIREEKHLLEAHPALTFQQALNSPDFTAPAAVARRAAERETRPRFRWVNKPQTRSPCVRTMLGHGDYVNSCDVAENGDRMVSASSDTELKVWDAATGDEVSKLRGHASSVETCAFSPDGKRILSGAKNGEVKIWDAVSGDEVLSLTGHNAPVLSCKFSPDGTRAVSASRDGTLKIWRADNGLELHTLRGRGDQVSCAYSPDGNWIVAGGNDGHLTLWDSSTGRELLSFGDHKKAITGCVFTPDGKSVVSASEDHTVRRWDVATGQETNTYGEFQQTIWAIAVSRDGDRLAAGAQDGSIAFWDVETADALARVTEHLGQVSALAFFPDGSRVLSGSWDRVLKIWNVETAEQIEREQRAPIGAENADSGAQQQFMICCCRSPNGAWLAAGSSDGSLTLWDAATGATLGVFSLHRDFVMACVFSPDSRWIVSGAWDGSLRSFDREERREGPAFELPEKIFSCAFSQDGKRMVAGCASVIMVWDVEGLNIWERCAWHSNGERFVSCAVAPDGGWIIAATKGGKFVVWDVDREAPVRSFEGDPGVVCCTLSPDARRLASGCDPPALRIWDVTSGQQLQELIGHTAEVVSCNFSVDGRRLVSGSYDQTVRIWELEIPGRATVLSGHTDQVQDACFTADGNRILSVAVDGTARLWDAATGAWLGYLLSPEDSALLCIYSPDRQCFLTASHRHSLKLWSGETGQFERLLVGHRNAVRACSFSVQGQLVSASADGTLKLWDVASSEPSRSLVGHTGPVQSCAFSPDGSWIVSGGWDKTIRLWGAGNGEVLATLRGHDGWVQVVLVTADGSRIVSCAHDKTIVIWDAVTGQRIHTLNGHNSVINAAALSPDGSRLVTGSEDGILNVWELRTGRRISSLAGHTGAIRDCAFTKRILSASHDHTLRLWEAEGGNPLELSGHAGPVLVCRFSPDGQQALSGSVDKFLKLWDSDTGALLGEYWAGASVQSIAWQPASRRIALGDGAGKLHLLELEGALQ
jgi:WD40 repeat protein